MYNINRQMNSDHIDRTADSARSEVVSLATVVGMREESKTVKSLTLKVEDKQFSFKAGQWVDMFIPGVETIGGFSMCSSPLRLTEDQCLDLAVKYSEHPPAYWVHTKCKVREQVKIRVGGDFFFDPAVQKDVDLLLIAGGVGINPVYSIINEVADLNKGDSSSRFSGKVKLLFSARTTDELVFKEQLNIIQNNNEHINCQFHVTREKETTHKIGDVLLLNKRIQTGDLDKSFNWLRKENTCVYICGPSHMIEDVELSLLQLNIAKQRIKYEKWW
ncbi:oxidoreductase NAD-binding domain-containing protein 1-like [Ruditapes philippinarum]|uniref:oxidoreductase NAD-binding domain-containing protein 1-like n=1 Tax=Ruditapes philippinarum TaxID=129788 RepID=UPI00295ADB49|nr:oxidoreductase NAD-binding domain-containing protein 1-like [Ruditapes philippinarum]